MFVNFTKKLILLRVTKTASTSLLRFFIEQSDDTDVLSHCQNGDEEGVYFNAHNCSATVDHNNINEIIANGTLTQDAISEYNIYGVLRNPVDRFISGCYHSMACEPHENLNVFIRRCLDYGSRPKTMFLPQQYWLTHQGQPISHIYLYEDIPQLVSDVFGATASLTYYNRSHIRQHRSSILDDSLVKEIIMLYPKDYEMYQTLLEKRNSK